MKTDEVKDFLFCFFSPSLNFFLPFQLLNSTHETKPYSEACSFAVSSRRKIGDFTQFHVQSSYRVYRGYCVNPLRAMVFFLLLVITSKKVRFLWQKESSAYNFFFTSISWSVLTCQKIASYFSHMWSNSIFISFFLLSF